MPNDNDTRKIDKLIVTTDSEPRAWMVVEAPGTSELLIGWLHDEFDVEDGPPPQVKELMSELIVSTGSAVYGRPEGSEGPQAQNVGQLSGFEFNGLLGMFGPKIDFIWTDKADVIQRLFYTEYMQWAHEGQFAIIYKSKSAPTIPHDVLLATVKRQEFGNKALKNTGAVGSMVPGADGDFIHMIFFEQSDRDGFLKSLEEACASKKLGLEKITGAQFEEMTWYVTVAPAS